jgi:hypothetical protein
MLSRLASKKTSEDIQAQTDVQLTTIRAFAERNIACYLTDVAKNFLEFFDKNKKTRSTLIKDWLGEICSVIASAASGIFKNGYFQDRLLITPLKLILEGCLQHTDFLFPPSANIKRKMINFLQRSTSATPKDPLYCRDHFIAVQKNQDCTSGKYCLKDFERMGTDVKFNGKIQDVTLSDSLPELNKFLRENLFASIDGDKKKNALCRLFAMHTHQGAFNYATASFLQFDMAYNLALKDYKAYTYLLPKTAGDNSELDFNFYSLESGYGVKSTFSYFEGEGKRRICILQLSSTHEITLDLSNPDQINFDKYDFSCTKLSCEYALCTEKTDEGVRERANQYLDELKNTLDNKSALLPEPKTIADPMVAMKTFTVNRDELKASEADSKGIARKLLSKGNATLFAGDKKRKGNDNVKCHKKRKSVGGSGDQEMVTLKKPKTKPSKPGLAASASTNLNG